MTSEQQTIDELKTTLREVAKSSGDEPVTATERMRAALALAALTKAVTHDGTLILEGYRLDALRNIINGKTV